MSAHRYLTMGVVFLALCAREGRPWRAAARPALRQQPLKMMTQGGSSSGHVLLSGLAATGAVETGYLTLQKLTASPISSALCNSGAELDSCNTVLSGPYSVIPVVNFPLAGAAFVVYSAIAVLSLLSLQDQQGVADSNSSGSSSSTNNNSILFLSTTMATFSAYLVALLRLVLQTSCNYCYLSAAISFALAAVAWTQGIVPNKTRAFVVTASSMALTTVTSAFLFYSTSVLSLGVPSAQASTAPAAQYLQQEEARSSNKVEKAEAPSPPPVTSASSPEALAVASRLQKLDAKMYGAYWCSHCFNQKQALGLEAKAKFAYIECDKEGKNSQYDMCKSKKIPGYPTWEIQGNYYPGEKSVQELGALLTKIEAAGVGER